MSSGAANEPASGASALEASARVAELFERHGRMALGICRAMLRDPHEAEDAAQQTFLSAHRSLLTGTLPRDTGAWVAAIARNECRARISAVMRSPLVVGDHATAVPQAPDDVERRLQAEEFANALARLPERQREAVVLRYVLGLRYGEVATALGLSRPATDALLFRARRAMRIRLRHAGAALVVPLSLKDELAAALPGFEQADTATGVGLAGGLLAKLATAPTAAKITTAALAASAVGAVGVVQSDSSQRDGREAARAAEISSGTRARAGAALVGLVRLPERRPAATVGRPRAVQEHGPKRLLSDEHGDAASPRDGDPAGSASGAGERSTATDPEREGSTAASSTESHEGTVEDTSTADRAESPSASGSSGTGSDGAATSDSPGPSSFDDSSVATGHDDPSGAPGSELGSDGGQEGPEP